ncbi:hypothetical protein NC651_005794 [Populus alba x Populus x berolinensis]|nr:hypothetical protein NC651_005794 [Populus alba x Populus x berolinensis]
MNGAGCWMAWPLCPDLMFLGAGLHLRLCLLSATIVVDLHVFLTICLSISIAFFILSLAKFFHPSKSYGAPE